MDRHRLEPLALDGEVAGITLDVLGCEIRVRTVSWRLLNLVLGVVRLSPCRPCYSSRISLRTLVSCLN